MSTTIEKANVRTPTKHYVKARVVITGDSIEIYHRRTKDPLETISGSARKTTADTWTIDDDGNTVTVNHGCNCGGTTVIDR